MHTTLRISIVLLFLASGACAKATDYDAATGGDTKPQVVEVAGYQELLDLFAQLDYTPEAWQTGIREVPRIYLSDIPERWSKSTSRDVEVRLKKQIFFRALGPLALRSNELILADRKRLQELLTKPDAIGGEQEAWLDGLAKQYGLDTTAYKDRVELAETLLPRVDIVPASLVLAQAAEESGWGTSRFAFTGNALFGQWTWGEDGIRPEEQRGGRGDYKIAAFDAPLQSVQAHALNLNTHSAYLQFRLKRAQARKAGRPVRGDELAGALTSYSERGADYVKTIRSIISYNKLADTESASLNDNQPIVLITTGD
jgi:uncharacterized FlgJ-related protein